MTQYFKAGVKEVWLVQPEDRTVEMDRVNLPEQGLTGEDQLLRRHSRALVWLSLICFPEPESPVILGFCPIRVGVQLCFSTFEIWS